MRVGVRVDVMVGVWVGVIAGVRVHLRVQVWRESPLLTPVKTFILFLVSVRSLIVSTCEQE